MRATQQHRMAFCDTHPLIDGKTKSPNAAFHESVSLSNLDDDVRSKTEDTYFVRRVFMRLISEF